MEWEKIVLDNINLVWQVINDMNLDHKQDTEDYYQIGCIGLIEGIKNIDKYDKDKAQLSTFLYYCIRNNILREIQYWNRKKRKRKEELSLDYIYSTSSDGIEHTLKDVLASEYNLEEEVLQNIENKKLQYIMKLILTDKEYEYIVSEYGLFGNRELGTVLASKKIGLSRQWCWEMEKKAINKLKNFYKRYPVELEQIKDKEVKYGILR